MSWQHYSELEACIETETDWTGDHVVRQFVMVTMTDERCRLGIAVCQLTAKEAREVAFELLSIAELAEQEPHGREEQR